MQTDYKQIYQELAKETGKSESLYKDIGTFIFQETARMMKDPTHLIIKMKGVGSWHLRRKRMNIVVHEWTDRSEVKTREDFTSDSAFDNYQEKHRRYLIFEKRLKDYEDYVADKQVVRLERNKTQFLLTPKDTTEKYKSE